MTGASTETAEVVPAKNQMTKTGDNSNHFNARADNAALGLRQALVKDGAQMPESASVEVGPDGKPPAPLPPEGSYARNAIETQRQHAREIGDQPTAGTTEQAMDGSQAPPLTPPNGQGQSAPEQTSPRAEQRIHDLVSQLREKDKQMAEMVAQAQNNPEVDQLKMQLQQLQQQHQEVMQANLDQLDPETRMQVLNDQRTQQLLQGFKQEILNTIGPQLNDLQDQRARDEMSAMAEKYPAFDVVIHKDLIDHFRGANPRCSIEQAWKAVATSEELVTREQAQANAVPPVLPPGATSMQDVRYAPTPAGSEQSDPQEEINELNARFAKLRGSADPIEQKQGMDMLNDLLKKRLQ